MKVFLADVPNDKTIVQHIKDTTDFEQAKKKIEDKYSNYHNNITYLNVEPSALDNLKIGTLKAVDKYGLHSFLFKSGRPPISAYDSFSITYNPNSEEDPHLSTLGTNKITNKEGFYGTKETMSFPLKNSYYDTFAFNTRTPATYVAGFDEFTSSFNTSLVRSRCSAIRPNWRNSSNFDFGWHRDESIFENLRIIIPVITNDCFRMQFEPNSTGIPQEDSITLIDFNIPYGKAAVFDSNKPHRAYRAMDTDLLRIHVIFGVSPWFNYLPEEQAWESNECYGNIHPFDMLKQGLISPYIYE